VHQVRISGTAVEITERGKVIAELIPAFGSKTTLNEDTAVDDLDKLAQIGAAGE
jgi:antitoxin (DNA-binding transcriptional repressor) of toxin-antitoxin stability system